MLADMWDGEGGEGPTSLVLLLQHCTSGGFSRFLQQQVRVFHVSIFLGPYLSLHGTWFYEQFREIALHDQFAGEHWWRLRWGCGEILAGIHPSSIFCSLIASLRSIDCLVSVTGVRH